MKRKSASEQEVNNAVMVHKREHQASTLGHDRGSSLVMCSPSQSRELKKVSQKNYVEV